VTSGLSAAFGHQPFGPELKAEGFKAELLKPNGVSKLSVDISFLKSLF